MALNIHCRAKLMNKLIPVLKKTVFRKMMFAEHCICHPEEIASKSVLWMKEKRSASHDIPNYTLMPTTGIKNLDELKNIYDGLGQLEMTD